jgi:acetyltransferase-like isoleucine patch superfamily enzyme
MKTSSGIMVIKIFYMLLRDSINKIRKVYIARKYNDFNIAEYFRNQGAVVGEHNRIMIRSLGEAPFLVRIGSHCSISPGVQFETHDGGGWIFTGENPSLQRFGRIEVKDNCFIGVSCIILANVTIGPNSIVGAGSVVTKDVPANTVVAGNPARVIKTIEEYREKVESIWDEQKPIGYFGGIQKDVKYAPDYIQKIKNRDRELLKEHLIRIIWKR